MLWVDDGVQSRIARADMKRILGIDHGEARIGLAISDELGMLAHALETVHLKEVADPVERIAQITARESVEVIVLGLPRNMNGTYGPAAEKVRAFGEQLKERTGCQVKMWDERLTSVAAQRSLHEAGRNVKQSRAVIDQVAAQMILQGYLDSQAMQL
jgi:putative Holliday junction resolvase